MSAPNKCVSLQQSEFPRPFPAEVVELLVALLGFLLCCCYLALVESLGCMVKGNLRITAPSARCQKCKSEEKREMSQRRGGGQFPG